MTFSNTLNAQILDSLSEGIYTVDKNFRIQFINKQAENILGVERQQVIGKFCKQVFSSCDCLENCPMTQVLKSEEKLFDHVTKYKHHNGSAVNVRINAAALYNDQGDVTGGVLSFRDLDKEREMYARSRTFNDFYGVIGRHKSMLELYDLIQEIQDTDATVLIQGESGTGKEIFANAIQVSSRRAEKPYVKVNCSVFPAQLLASELFGHVKGAFTDAFQNRKGRFEIADTGTLFLDEVAEMPLFMQLQLLRVIQEGTFERVGESLTRNVNVRIIAATNKNIEQAIHDGSFREDLFYRLNVIPLIIPPLRERAQDIPLLATYFLEQFSHTYNKQISEIDENAMEIMLNYPWPGNVREMVNALEYAFIRTKPLDNIRADILPISVHQNKVFTTRDSQQNERQQIVNILEKFHWNRSLVAREMGIGRTTLWRKMKELGIETKV